MAFELSDHYATVIRCQSSLISESQFALAISRDVSGKGAGGQLVFGEVPNDVLTSSSVNATGPVATANLEHIGNHRPYEYYTIEVDGLVYENSAKLTYCDLNMQKTGRKFTHTHTDRETEIYIYIE